MEIGLNVIVGNIGHVDILKDKLLGLLLLEK